MTCQEALKSILPCFESYYSIKTEDVTPPFTAEAEFRCHTENYILVKAAKIADIDSNEFVYFSIQKKLDSFLLNELSNIAWNVGLKKVKPYNGHKNSDITLIVFADSFSGELKKVARKIKMSKNYKFGFYGWSNFRLCVFNAETREIVNNFHGRDIKKLFAKTGLLSCK